MNYQKQQKYISATRLSRYESVCQGDEGKVAALYKANIRLSHSFFPVLAVFEVAYRNSLDKEFADYLDDPDWIQNGLHGFMEHPELRQRGHRDHWMKKKVQSVVNKLTKEGTSVSQGRLIADMTFGFWTEFFERKHYRILGGRAIQVFPNRPSTVKRSHLYDRLTQIRLLRNRIAHHEPICFTPRSHAFNLTQAGICAQYLSDLLRWMDSELLFWTQDLDQIQKELIGVRDLIQS